MDRRDPWFESLYLTYGTKLLKTAVTELDDRGLAEEVVQDVYMLLLTYREKVETYEKPQAWLYLTLYNRIKNELRRACRKREVPLGPEHELAASTYGEFDRLEYMLPQGLKKKERELLIWYFQDNLAFAEMAGRLNCSEHACEMRLSRTKKKITQAFIEKTVKKCRKIFFLKNVRKISSQYTLIGKRRCFECRIACTTLSITGWNRVMCKPKGNKIEKAAKNWPPSWTTVWPE